MLHRPSLADGTGVFQGIGRCRLSGQFNPGPIKGMPIGMPWQSRERAWLAKYADTHMTLAAISAKYGVSKDKLETCLLPPPDKACPHGSRTRLWRRDVVAGLLGGKV
ncbi:MAG: hypothetical protein ABL933_15730 [Methyloglobulus sp.]